MIDQSTKNIYILKWFKIEIVLKNSLNIMIYKMTILSLP